MYMMLYTSLLYNTTPIHCTPLPLHPPVMNTHRRRLFCTVSFHNFKSRNFKLSVSNPKSKYVAYLSVLAQISDCQGLGRKNKYDILKTDRRSVAAHSRHLLHWVLRVDWPMRYSRSQCCCVCLVLVGKNHNSKGVCFVGVCWAALSGDPAGHPSQDSATVVYHCYYYYYYHIL